MSAYQYSINPSPATETEEAYIYALLDPDTREVRYIGKSINPEERLRGHIAACGLRRNVCQKWIYDLKQAGKRPSIRIVEAVVSEDWSEREIHWIAHFIAIGSDLLNSTRGGGSGYRITSQASARLSATMSRVRKGMKFSPSHVANMLDARRRYYESHPEAGLAISRRQAKLTDEQVVEVYRLAASRGLSQREIGKRYGISQRIVSGILSGERYAYVPRPDVCVLPNYDDRGKQRKAIACKLFSEGVPREEIASQIGIPVGNVTRILGIAGVRRLNSRANYQIRVERAVAMRQEGMDNKTIAAELGITPSGVWLLFKRSAPIRPDEAN